MKVLVIEDNLELRENIVEILFLAGFKTLSASNGKQGIIVAKEHLPDLIICDIMMPELDGYGVLHILSKMPDVSNIPFIFLTAKSEKSDYRKGMELGADDYITKPFEDTELLSAIENQLKKREKLKKYLGGGEQTSSVSNITLIELSKEVETKYSVKSYNDKQEIFGEGDTVNYVYLLIDGEVKTFKTDYYGKRLTTNIYQKGEWFGYTDLLDEDVFKESAQTHASSEIIRVPKHYFLEQIEKNAALNKDFLHLLSAQLNNRQEKLLELAYSPVRERVASALVELSKTTEEINMSREDLAAIVGTATESVIRCLSELKKENTINIKQSAIYVINRDRLIGLLSGNNH